MGWLNRVQRALEKMPPPAGALLTILLVAGVGATDYATGSETSVSILYFIPVGLSAWFAGRRASQFVTVLSGLAWFLADRLSRRPYEQPLTPYWNALVMTGIFLVAATLLAGWKKARDRERRLAREIQQGMLPTVLPDIPGYQAFADWHPAEEVGGDYYDLFPLAETQTGVCIADATGHGMPAALLMSNLQATFRITASAALPPREICTIVNRFIARNIAPGHFVTLFYGRLDTVTGEFCFTNAGHNPPLFLPAGGGLQRLRTDDPAIGLDGAAAYRQGSITFAAGDILLLFTDGIVEATDRRGEFFGDGRLQELLQANRHLAAPELGRRIVDAVQAFARRSFADDLTMLLIKRE